MKMNWKSKHARNSKAFLEGVLYKCPYKVSPIPWPVLELKFYAKKKMDFLLQSIKAAPSSGEEPVMQFWDINLKLVKPHRFIFGVQSSNSKITKKKKNKQKKIQLKLHTSKWAS